MKQTTSTGGVWLGDIKKPSGKKLPSGYAQVIFPKPNVKSFAISESESNKPMIVFGAILGLQSYSLLLTSFKPLPPSFVPAPDLIIPTHI